MDRFKLGVSIPIQRWAGNACSQSTDSVADEEPLEIQVDTRPISVTMRTPGHDEELAVGFLISEGLLRKREDLGSVQPYPRNAHGNAIGIFTAPTIQVDYAMLTRHVFGSSSCGLCGVATIEAIQKQFALISEGSSILSTVLQELPTRMRAGQKTFDETGGLHAAALFDSSGCLEVLREDVGRHNAVDKVLGWAFLRGQLPLNRHTLLVSGRASFEIIQKGLAAGIPIVAAVGAPSSLAVRLAEAHGQTLIGFLREGRFNVYSGFHRVIHSH